jgi:hypothetical protein
MSVLSPMAQRFIALALSQSGDERQHAAWQAWTGIPDQTLPSYLAQVALHALSGMALRLEDRIADETTDPAAAAQMENDLGYIVDVEEVLLEHLRQPVPAYS